jgi:hypothetical protein
MGQAVVAQDACHRANPAAAGLEHVTAELADGVFSLDAQQSGAAWG